MTCRPRALLLAFAALAGSVAPIAAAAGPGCGDEIACGDLVDCGSAAAAPVPWTLDDFLGLGDSDFFIAGHVQQGLNVNSRNPGNPAAGFGNAPAAGLVYRANDYLLNQLYVSMGNVADTSRDAFDIGYQVDLVYGSDYVFLRSLGLERHRDGTNRWNGDDGSGYGGVQRYGLAMPELAATFAYEETRLTVGHFYNILGHEALIPTENFYYTSNYALFFNGYGESVPITGAFLQTQLDEHWLVGGGFHRGQGKWEDNNNKLNGVGMIEWANTAKNLFLTYTFDVGAEDDAGQNAVFAQCAILEWQISKRWGYVLNSCYGSEENVAAGGATGRWYGIANYLAHSVSDKLVLGIRYDFFDDVDGTRVFPRAGFPALAPGAYHGLTLGANYFMIPNATLRPEVRWDWFSPDGALPPGPFDNGVARSQFMAAVDLLVTF
ncbi:MAG: outer membrane beta-barrel protein [Pirellulales bacterium]|nr:outer membrane beta-barrel protein [Pirellulales bacterium]